MKLKQEEELAALRTDLCEIKSALRESLGQNNDQSGSRGFGGNSSGYRNRNRRGLNKCKQCIATGSFVRCMHCFKCGSENHRMAECSSKNGE